MQHLTVEILAVQVLDIDDGEVIGVVSSKLAPIPSDIESALDALSKQKYGFSFYKISDSGKKDTVTEGQVVAEVLNYLRSQTQLVLGHAVTSTDLLELMKQYNIK